ncbi:decarboxylase [Nocardia sp. NBC_01377]|uniref:decarboxylase n=1 Tax=Nocardia sp. NBC_01377 TaxID=2903595 RepID=UPI00324636F6
MTPPSIPAAVAPLVGQYLDTAVTALAAEHGTPLHVVFPQVFADNLREIRTALDTRAVEHRIFYAHKVNRSRAFARAAFEAGIDIDIASPGEFDNALAAGFPADRIEATGPKGESFLRRLITTGVTVNVDNLWELERIGQLAERPVPVLLRVGDIPGTATSRFGIPLSHLTRAFDILDAVGSRMMLRGLSFHLDTADARDRLRAVAACAVLLEQAWSRGFEPSVLDIGGGLRQVFTADATGFDTYTRALRESLGGRGRRMAWANAAFGYQVEGDTVRGTPVFHKYGNTVPPAAALGELLDTPVPGHRRSLSALLSDNMLQLWLEPGKALVDRAGITVASVEFTKELADGTILVHLDISRDTVTPADQEVLVDPRLVAIGPPPAPEPVGVFLAGRLCLERDMVSNRAVRLPFRPRAGDLLVFANTAGYNSDLSAASAGLHPLPPKFAAARGPSGFVVVPDAEYRPVEEESCARTTASPN